MAADSAVRHTAHGVGTDLAGEVHFDGRVDGHHAVVARDDHRVVAVGRPVEFENGVVVDEIEQALAAQHEAGDYFARVQRFARAVHYAALN